jgi:serine/threonine protein kinase
MTTDAFHPDHLKPGDMVGPWRIVESLGSGSSGHAFKAEREGEFFTLKMAVRPAPLLPRDTPEETLEERQVDARMYHEAAVLMAHTSHPGLPHVRAVDRWPHPIRGYLFIVTDFVPGGPFHEWREQTRPSLAQLVDVFVEVVRTVGRLHNRGVLIRDFKSDHVIVDPADNNPVLVDMGSAWLPGGSALTVGLAPGTPHALPPECVTFIRQGAWKEGARFDANAAGDLYQLGVFLYEALTDGWPFNPRMTKDQLLLAIETIVPRAPHRINPQVPESLSRITLKLLEKRPEDRYESTETLLQALWDAAKERATKAWKVPLSLPAEGPAPVTREEEEERRLQQQEAVRKAQETHEQQAEELSHAEALEQLSFLTQSIEDQVRIAEEKAARRKSWWRRFGLATGALLLGLTLLIVGWMWLAPASLSIAASEKGRSLVFTVSNSQPVKAAALWLCATLSIGCPSAQVRPFPENCPAEAVKSMEEMEMLDHPDVRILIDINQPGARNELGTYHSGKVVGRVVPGGYGKSPLPTGTLLYGQLWTEGLVLDGEPAVLGRYTEAILPDGRRLPVCVQLHSNREGGLKPTKPGSKPGAAILQREDNAIAVDFWP